MIQHRTRMIAAVVIVLAAVGILAADQWLQLAEETRKLLASIVSWGLLAIGAASVADSFKVEQRRRDPSRPALPDDVRDELPPER